MSTNIDSFLTTLKKTVDNNETFTDRLVLEHYACQISMIDYQKPLVFTFDNMTTANSAESLAERTGWGNDFLVGLGYNVCSFIESDRFRWYRHEEFYQLVEAISAKRVFQKMA
ncbi:hypothetical protein [Psychrobacter sp.]|uniref:hypothetical protein n=1 Tax=Psychrobacter sp. TaxID=56811 RepID=UPI002649C307|nr:hypothetical protein [Psychrobacter sp.]MDN6276158.1 hypothetical protein [Psychrobacter sp.]MDN6309008.1 hypothetical protein [Psychrobacter sp.]